MGWGQQLAGSLGKALNIAGSVPLPFGGGQSANQLAHNIAPNFTLASSLQNYGGNQSGQGFAWVPQAYASAPSQPATQPNSQVLGVQTKSPVVPNGVGSNTGGTYLPSTGGGSPAPATSGQPSGGGGDTSGGGGYDYIGALRNAFGQQRDALSNMLPTYDSDLSNYSNSINQSVDTAKSTLADQNQQDEKLYGQNLKQLLQNDQEAGQRRYGTYSALGSLDSSSFQNDTNQAQQSLLDRQAELGSQKNQMFNDRQKQFSQFQNDANSKIAAYGNEIARAKEALKQSIANVNMDEASNIQNYISGLQQQAQQLQAQQQAAALNLAQLQAQGTDVVGNLQKTNLGAFSNLFGQNLANSLQAQLARYAPAAGGNPGSGYIGSSASDQQRKLLGL